MGFGFGLPIKEKYYELTVRKEKTKFINDSMAKKGCTSHGKEWMTRAKAWVFRNPRCWQSLFQRGQLFEVYTTVDDINPALP